MDARLTIGHIDPCLAQFTILSIVARVYSTPFLGCSRLCWLVPSFAMSNARRVAGTPAGADDEDERKRGAARSEGAGDRLAVRAGRRADKPEDGSG